ncbi:MAG: methylmalonyl Co-A mutase-associated GTPase MeaB [Anaerolineae bacterium]|nr:methylmalonyl Co-A mutase-associated GTPase MeaB [Anaerolineae bacterium]
MKGVEGGHDGMAVQPQASFSSKPRPRRRQLSVDDYVQGVLANDRMILGRTITLIESNSVAHMDMAQAVLKQLLPHTGNSIRIGITGVPGVGKSTFIEAFGCYLLEQGHKVAVLAVDPTSTLTKGSILGDKTRMERLSREKEAFIRPSPTSGMLGGVTRKSRETMLVCEAAGFDVILMETVGVGQSETMVRSMVDFFMLLMLAGAGDELQGIKKGIMELADALVINKADGDNVLKAKRARAEYNQAIHYLAPATEGWQTKAYICSALMNTGVPDIWGVVDKFRQSTSESGMFEKRRRAQMVDWVHTMVEEHLKSSFFNHPGVKSILPNVESAVADGVLPATTAVKQLLTKFESNREEEK